ncbi:MAG: preprotein translocase subunit Sec61beta [Candidatus Hadarchaeales archaeon]
MRERERMPASRAGLIRYFEEEGFGIKIDPKKMIYFTIGFIIFMIGLHIFGPAI